MKTYFKHVGNRSIGALVGGNTLFLPAESLVVSMRSTVSISVETAFNNYLSTSVRVGVSSVLFHVGYSPSCGLINEKTF